METKPHNNHKEAQHSNQQLVSKCAFLKQNGLPSDKLSNHQVEYAVNQNEINIKQIIDHMHVGVAILDSDHNVIQSNKMYQELLPKNSLGKRPQQCDQCDKVDHNAICASCPISSGDKKNEFCAQFDLEVNGHRRNFRIIGNPIYNHDQKVIGTIHVIEEVSSQVDAEVALQQALRFVDTTKELMWYYDKDYRYLAANQAYCEAFQCELKEIIGKHSIEVISEVAFRQVKSSLDKCLGGMEIHREFWKTFPAYDLPRYVEVVYQPCIDPNGEVTGIVGRMHDITFRKIAQDALERRLELEKIIATISTDFISLPYNSIDSKIIQSIEQVVLFQNIDRGSIFLFDNNNDDGGAWQNAYQWVHPKLLGSEQVHHNVIVEKDQYVGRIILAKNIFSCANVHDLPKEATSIKKSLLMQGVKSIICVPVMLEGKVVGFFGLDSIVEEVIWSEQTETLLKVVANIFSTAIGRKKHIIERDIYKKRLRTLAIQLSKAEEKERRSLAEKLHDSIGQLLAASRLKVNLLNQDPDVDSRKIMEIDHLLEQTIQQTRDLTFNLCPPELYTIGLGAGIDRLVGAFKKDHALNVFLEEVGQPYPLSEALNILLYQAVRELLFNIVKHADANHVLVSLSYAPDKIMITVEDDGCGFDAPTVSANEYDGKGFGLFNVKERLTYMGSSMSINSKIGQGTVIMIETSRG